MNPRMRLNNTVNQKLRENPGIRYRCNSGVATVTIGQMSWIGEYHADQREAKDSATTAVLNDIENLSEAQIREVCGLRPRIKLVEADAIRDVLRGLRDRVNGAWISDGSRASIYRKLGDLYNALDDVERVARACGVSEGNEHGQIV